MNDDGHKTNGPTTNHMQAENTKSKDLTPTTLKLNEPKEQGVIMAESINMAIVGTGYVGLTTVVVLAYIGHRVIGAKDGPQSLVPHMDSGVDIWVRWI